MLAPEETPDGRPGVSVLVFAFSRDALEKALANRVGQCVMTCPTTACYNGLPLGEKTINVGGRLRYFGDGWQISKRLEGRRYWRIPVMDGEFTCEETVRHDQGGRRRQHHPARDRPRGDARRDRGGRRARCGPAPTSSCRFPGGIARSGSKVGSKYKALRASTNTAFAPTLRGLVDASDLPEEVRCVYEIVIDGLSLEAVERATAVGPSRRPANGNRPRSRPGTTAASSGRSTSGCERFCRDTDPPTITDQGSSMILRWLGKTNLPVEMERLAPETLPRPVARRRSAGSPVRVGNQRRRSFGESFRSQDDGRGHRLTFEGTSAMSAGSAGG